MLFTDIKPLNVERNRQKDKVEQRCPRTKTALSENKTPDLPKVAGRTGERGLFMDRYTMVGDAVMQCVQRVRPNHIVLHGME